MLRINSPEVARKGSRAHNLHLAYTPDLHASASRKSILPGPDEWIDLDKPFPTVCGFEEATVVLNDSRMKAEYHQLFSAAGACQGRAEIIGQRTLLNLNGEEHRRLRGKVASEFRPRRVDRIRPFAQAIAARILQELPESQPFDIMQEFALPFIEKTTAKFLGVPLSDMEALGKSLELVKAGGADMHKRAKDFDNGCLELYDYALQALRDRFDHPTDDTLGHVSQQLKSGAIDEGFAGTFVVSLLSAGIEPTAFQLGILVEELAGLTHVWDGVALGDLKIPSVVEELLRFRSTNQGAARRVGETMDIKDFRFQKNATVIVSITAANHDPRRFQRPEYFDTEANKGSNLAFGFGPHFCIGAPLARAQLQEALKVLATELHCPTVIDVRSQNGNGLVGPLELTVAIKRR